MTAERRCGAPRDAGPCRRRVKHAGDRCHLHPATEVRAQNGTIQIRLLGGYLATLHPDRVTVLLSERHALRLAAQIHATTTIGGAP